MKKTYKIEVDCAACADKMEQAARKTQGVAAATVSFMTQKMKVEFAEGADAAIRAVGLQLPLPVDGLAQVHIRRVLDGEACLDHAAEEALLIPAEELLRGGVIRKFARAADKDLRMLPHGGQDLLAGGQKM